MPNRECGTKSASGERGGRYAMQNMALIGAALSMMQIDEPWPASVEKARGRRRDVRPPRRPRAAGVAREESRTGFKTCRTAHGFETAIAPGGASRPSVRVKSNCL